jgi:hypothetical protein
MLALAMIRPTSGVRYRFPPDMLSALAATIDAERLCCRFLRFEITVEPASGPIWVSLSGPPWNARVS